MHDEGARLYYSVESKALHLSVLRDVVARRSRWEKCDLRLIPKESKNVQVPRVPQRCLCDILRPKFPSCLVNWWIPTASEIWSLRSRRSLQTYAVWSMLKLNWSILINIDHLIWMLWWLWVSTKSLMALASAQIGPDLWVEQAGCPCVVHHSAKEARYQGQAAQAANLRGRTVVYLVKLLNCFKWYGHEKTWSLNSKPIKSNTEPQSLAISTLRNIFEIHFVPSSNWLSGDPETAKQWHSGKLWKSELPLKALFYP